MLTAPRPKPTLSKTLASVEAAGWREFVLSLDNCPMPERPEAGLIHRYWRHEMYSLGPWPHYVAALRRSLRTLSWDALCVLQDDVVLAKGLRDALESSALASWQRCHGLVSLWLAGWHSRNPNWVGQSFWWRLPPSELPRRCYGALAMIWRRWQVQAIVGSPPGEGRTRADYWIGRFCKDENVPLIYPQRSFVQHAGEGNSTLGDTPRSKQYRLADDPISDCKSLW